MTNETNTPTPTTAGPLDEQRRELALFRYGVIADLVQLEPHHRGLYALLAKKAAVTYDIPGTLRRRIAAETIRGWLRSYRKGGFDALVPRPRSDQGSTRSIPPQVIDVLCQLKEDDFEPSVPSLIKTARALHADVVTDEVVLPESTVHRALARRGVRKKPPVGPPPTTGAASSTRRPGTCG
ncbi:MAG: helix-turn-helix domain-containing protein [Polyangiaceae bacterium]|nr:helix-turn-helix domain-containing protein [Polyangiaceae bacterium]